MHSLLTFKFLQIKGKKFIEAIPVQSFSNIKFNHKMEALHSA